MMKKELPAFRQWLRSHDSPLVRAFERGASFETVAKGGAPDGSDGSSGII
jgi:hypothetical protein